MKARAVVLGIAVVSAAAFVACGKDATSPAVQTNTSSNGTTIVLDSAVTNQTAIAGSTIHVFVTVKSSSGSPVKGDTVTWNVATGGGSVPSKTTITGADGVAATDWTLGTVAGANSLGATIPGAGVPIAATGIRGPLTQLVKQSPDSQNVTATGSVLLTVRAADANGNAVDSVTVNWLTTGGTVSPTSTVTSKSGNSSVNFTTPAATASRYTVTAFINGVAPVSFIVKTL